MQLDDRSRYTVLPPRVWGLIPRLASRMRIEQVKAIFSREAAQGFMLSLELHDCEATGFQNEPGNFICRYRRAPPVGRVTYSESPELRKTSITLQDGCFGAGALMRIAAMFVRPDREGSVQDSSEIEVQAAPVAAVEGITSVPEPPSSSVPDGAQPHRSDSAASGSDASAMTTAPEEGSAASPGQKSSSSHSRDSSFRQPWKASGSSPLPFEDIFEDPTGASGTPPDSGSRPSSRNTDSSGPEQPSSASDQQKGAPQEILQSAVEGAALSSADAPADGLPGEGQCEADAERHRRDAAAGSQAAPERKDQFSLEIVRCRAVAPDWQDTSAASSRPYWDRQHALTLNVPQLLLQLPPTNPAKHPAKHPVEVHSFDSASSSAPAAEDDAQEGLAHESSTPSIPGYEGSAQRQSTVISAVQLAFHVEVFDPGKAPHVGYTSPFISIPDISMTFQGLQPAPDVTPDASASRPVLLPATRMQIPNAILDVAPGRLAVLLAAITWGQGELAHILGRTAEQTPHQHRPPAMPLMSRLMRLSPVTAVATVQKCSLRLRGASPMQTALQLDMTGLEAEAVRLPEEAVGLRVKLPQLHLALMGLPESSNAEESAPDDTGLEQASRSPKGLGRSASAPSPPLTRAETPPLKLEPITPWMPDDTADFQSSSSVGSDSSPISQLGDRTASTGLAEATMLGSSPDEASQPVFTARQASGALSTLGMFRGSPEGSASPLSSRRSSVDSAGNVVRFLDARSGSLSTASMHRLSSGSSTGSASGNAMYDAVSSQQYFSNSSDTPSGSGLAMFDARSSVSSDRSGGSREAMYDASSSAFSNRLHRVSSNGTNTSSNSGTEWYEAGDADSSTPRTGGFTRDEEETPQPEEGPAGKMLSLASFTAVDSSAAGMLGQACDAVPSATALLRATEAAGDATACGHLGPVMLRLFTEGWDVAILILQSYRDALPHTSAPDAASGRASGPMGHEDSLQQSASSLTVHLLIVDVIATSFKGDSPRVPCATLGLATRLEAHTERSALTDMAAKDIRAALSFGSSNAADDISRSVKQESGMLFALRDGQGVITRPSSAPGADYEMAVHGGTMVLWASQTRLCCAALFLQAARSAASTLTADESTNVVQLKASRQSRVQQLGTLDVSIRSAVLHLSSEAGDADRPLAELCLNRLGGRLELEEQSLSWELDAQLAVNIFSASHAGWEPVLEPWRCQILGAFPIAWAGRKIVLGGGMSIALSSAEVLNLTATYTMFEAIEGVRRLVRQAQDAATRPEAQSLLNGGKEPAAGTRTAAGVVHRVQNNTELSLECWIAPPSQPPRNGFETVLVESASAASPPSVASDSPAASSGSAGDMGHFFDSTEQSAAALSASASMATLQQAASKRRARPERLALFYMLAGQEGLAGAIPLSRDSRGFHGLTLRPGASSGTYRVSVAYDVAVQRHVETTISLHSGVQIVNSTMLSLSIGEQSSGKKAMTVLATIAPGEMYSMPVLRKEPGLISVRPAGSGAGSEQSQYQWSPSVRLQPLLDGVQASTSSDQPARPRSRVARHLSCQATQSGLLQASFCIGVRPSTSRAGWDLVVKAPLVVENMLPMPAEFLIRRKPSGQTPMRVFLQPKQLAYLHHTDIHHLDGVIVQAQGYQRSAPVRVNALQRSSDATGGMERAGSMDSPDEGQAVTSFQVASTGESSSTTTVQLAHTQDQECGGHILQVSCGLWVYNCTGMPLALQQGDLDVSQQPDPNEVTMDEVPKDWLPPYECEGTGSNLFRPESVKRAASKPSLQPKRQGMQQIMGSRRAGEVTTTPTRTRSTSRFGVAESLEGLPSYTQPSRWPSMRGSAAPGRRRLRVQLRMSNMRAPYGRSFWSEPLQLDALGGAAIVSVPCPGPSPSYAQPDARAAYALSVTASQVPGTSGALALVVMPRYVLRNSLGQAVQFRQQETMLEKELAPGASRPLRWTDAALPRRLSVRIQDAGWLWSGGFALDTPGDIFVNIRHRDRGETRLVRVDICSTKGGVLIVNMSHQAAGFAPYRLDNCSPEVLHVRQLGCEEQQDILRPYSTINYAWDEPSLPHKLVLSLPGNRVLGVFELDKVGFRRVIGLPGDYSYQWRERQLLVMITAEGPTCVLTIADLQKHEISAADDIDSRHGDRLGWQPWSSPVISKAPASQRGAAVASTALHADVHAELAGVGLSIATPEAEVLYMLLDGIRVRGTSSKVSRTLETCIRSIQVDNPQRDAIFPVGFLSPAPVASLGLSMLPEAAMSSSSAAKAPALCGRVAVWQRTPAGVRCFERVEVHLGPALLEADQQHLDQVLAALQHALKPLRKLLPSTNSEEEGASDVDMLVASYNRAPTQERKVYIACMHISPINVTISFLPAELQRRDHLNPNDITGTALGTGLQRLVALVGEVEGGRITLAPLHMEHPLLGMTALQQQVQSHYLRAALPELVKLVGSANVLGDPAKLIHHLGLGVWSFLASPASGLVEGARRGAPERIAAGMLDGTRGLITNTVYAFSNATAKMSGAARKGLAALGLEPAESQAGLPLRARLRSRARDNAAPDANPGLLGALLNGVVGILSEPVRGAEQGGVPGLLRGASRGAAGALVQPLAFALETSVAVADSLRSAIMGIPPLLPRARPPRHVTQDEPLAVYNWSEAMGRALLLELERGRHAGEGFLLCRQLAASSDFAVLTEQHLLCIVKPSQSSAPALRWAMALRDVFHFDRDQQRLRLVALPPSAVKPARTLALLRRPLVVRPPSWPFFSASLQCQSAEDADMLCQGLQFTTQHGRALAFSPVLERQRIAGQGIAGQGALTWDP